jgi:arylformamidase
VVPGANHFTAIAPLADPQSPMVARLMELASR